MEETPISVLKKQVKFYLDFIDVLKYREDISRDDPDKIDKLIADCHLKIDEFNNAVNLLELNKFKKFKFSNFVKLFKRALKN